MPTILQKIAVLENKRKHIQEISDAYAEGIDIAKCSRRETLIECKREVDDQIIYPKTCRHPKARLSLEAVIRNDTLKDISRRINHLIESTMVDDDIPF